MIPRVILKRLQILHRLTLSQKAYFCFKTLPSRFIKSCKLRSIYRSDNYKGTSQNPVSPTYRSKEKRGWDAFRKLIVLYCGTSLLHSLATTVIQ